MSGMHSIRRLPWAAAAVLLLPAAALAGDGAASGRDSLHRMMVLVIQLGTILFAAKLGSVLFRRLRFPGALGELVAGMVIGPYALGGIGFHGFQEGLFPPNGPLGVSPELYGLAAIAAVVLMFSVGLETDLGLLLRYSAAGGLVGAGGVVAAFLAGAGVAALLGPRVLGGAVGLLSSPALFLGIVATATSVGITARVLSERRQLNSPEGVTILSAAVIDDVIGIVLLTVALGTVAARRGGGRIDWEHVGIVSAKAIGVWLLATVLGLLASRRISLLLKWFRDRTSIAILALGLALVLAGLFEEVGLAMIIGAYVMGLSLSRTDISHAVHDRLEPVYAFLVPVFFCVTGMRIDLGALTSPAVLAFGAAYAAAALAAKVLGCGLPSLLAGFNLRGALRIGFGMAPRCEVALIVAQVALTSGGMGPEFFAGVVLMIVVNTIVAPPVLQGLFRSGARGTRRPLEVGGKARTEIAFELPGEAAAELMVRELSRAFEADGYFVYVLGREPRLYQIRRDRTIIDLQADGPRLVFHCRREDAALVNTAMYESLAGLERVIKALGEPIDAGALAGRMQPSGPTPGQRPPSLAPYLRPELVEPALRATTKAEVIEELLDMLDRQGLLTDRALAGRDVWAREESMSTGLQFGVAIPHAKTEAVERLVCAVGLKTDGIDYGSLDGQPSRIFILTLSPKDRPTPHMRFMSIVGQLLDDRRRPHILAARSRQELYDLLCGAPIRAARPARAVGRPGKFRLSDYVRLERLAPRLSGTTPAEVIDELLGLLQGQGCLLDPAAARQAVMVREQQMPTGVADGVAIPHGRTDAVDRLVCAVGVHPRGVPFGATDRKPARIIVVALAPVSGDQPYLQFLAALMRALDEGGRDRVLAARTPEELYEALTGAPLAAGNDESIGNDE